MPSTRFIHVPALACAVLLFAAACGENKPVVSAVSCEPDGAASDATTSPDASVHPDVALTPDADGNPDVAAAPDATAVADIVPAADRDAALDAAGASDHPPPTDALVQYDGLLADGSLPPGITLGGYTIPHPTLSVMVSAGLLADLRASTGHVLYPPYVHIADVIHITQGYVGDIVYMKYGRLGPPPGIVLQPGVNYPFVVSFGGSRLYYDVPMPNPEATAAFALFDAMTKVPETTGADGRVRQSPNGRIRCNLRSEFDGAFCVFTGATDATMIHPPRYAPGVDGGAPVD